MIKTTPNPQNDSNFISLKFSNLHQELSLRIHLCCKALSFKVLTFDFPAYMSSIHPAKILSFINDGQLIIPTYQYKIAGHRDSS